MWKFNEVIFDEIIQTGGMGTYYTKQQVNDLLGQYDQLAFHILTDDVVAGTYAPTLQLWLETSCDGSNWVTKLASPPMTLSTTGLNQTGGQDDGSTPSYALVRFRVLFTCTFPATAHLVVWATGRDTGTRRARLVRTPTIYQYGAFYKNKYAPHELTDEQMEALYDLCRKRGLGYFACMKHFGPDVGDFKRQ